jgi:hypothetical protein
MMSKFVPGIGKTRQSEGRTDHGRRAFIEIELGLRKDRHISNLQGCGWCPSVWEIPVSGISFKGYISKETIHMT